MALEVPKYFGSVNKNRIMEPIPFIYEYSGQFPFKEDVEKAIISGEYKKVFLTTSAFSKSDMDDLIMLGQDLGVPVIIFRYDDSELSINQEPMFAEEEDEVVYKNNNNTYGWVPFDSPQNILIALTSGFFSRAYIEAGNCDAELIGVLKYISRLYNIEVIMVDSGEKKEIKIEDYEI